jgi:hypothetical protein
MADLNLEAFEELMKVSTSLPMLFSKRSNKQMLIRKETTNKLRMKNRTDEGQGPLKMVI